MIEFTDVVKSYTQGNKALNGVTMQIEDGEFCFLIGPSGSGKSTIIKLITSTAILWNEFASAKFPTCAARSASCFRITA